MGALQLQQVYADSEPPTRFIICLEQQSVVALDVDRVGVVNNPMALDFTDALTDYDDLDHAVVSCVIKSQQP